MRKLMVLALVLILLTGCSGKGVQLENASAADTKRAEEIFQHNKHVKLAVVLVEGKELLAGIRVNTFSRFKKKKIAAEIEKQLKESYPGMTITVSADSKVLLETEKLIKKGNKKQYKKKIKEIKSIEKEQT